MRTTTMQKRGSGKRKESYNKKEECCKEEDEHKGRGSIKSGDTHRNLIPRSHCPSSEPSLLDIQCLHSGPNFTNSLSGQKVIQ